MMKPALAKASNDQNKLEELGRATLQIVHDLKNQLNGLKLYATYLRKRLDREDRTPEERETIAKLIAGLDRSAKDITALVRYAQPIEMRKQSPVDLVRIVSALVADIATRETGGLPPMTIATEIEDQPLAGNFDPSLISHALAAITDDLRTATKSKDPNVLSITLRRQNNDALIEWKGATRPARQNPSPETIGFGTVHTKLGSRIIEAHGGRVKCENNTITVWLPLIEDL
jgi:signal transduction histidine kinase